jgi:hypothetical protein
VRQSAEPPLVHVTAATHLHEGRLGERGAYRTWKPIAPTVGLVEILWWLAPAAAATGLAMLWTAWAGRPEREDRDRSEAAYERFAAAMAKENPAAHRPRPPVQRDRSTGIAVRPSRRGE